MHRNHHHYSNRYSQEAIRHFLVLFLCVFTTFLSIEHNDEIQTIVWTKLLVLLLLLLLAATGDDDDDDDAATIIICIYTDKTARHCAAVLNKKIVETIS